MHRQFKRWGVSVLVLFLLLLTGIYGISGAVIWQLTHPTLLPVQQTPADYGLSYEDVTFTARQDQIKLKGWWLPAAASSHTVIFAHGYGRNRLQDDVPGLAIAAELIKNGYSVLMFDFRHSGQSEGEITSVGQFEVNDLLGAVDFVKSRGQAGEHVALLGFSMGAATALMAGAREARVEAIIADSPFADLTAYLEENLPVWSHLPAVPFNRTIMAIAPAITGLDPAAVSPLKEIGAFQGRLLLIHGDSDQKIPHSNSQQLLAAATTKQKQLLMVKQADHVKSFATDGVAYLEAVKKFLDDWRRNQ